MTTQDNWTFEEAYKKLPPDAQERVQAWLGTQMFIARELALPRETWLGYVEWALRNPFDYSFLGEEGIQLLAAVGDSMVNAAQEKARSLAVGGAPKAAGGALTNPQGADNKTAKKAGLANIHTLGNMLDEKRQKK